jgi:dihydrofolate reductase
MGKLIYSTIASLDGYVEDAEGHFDWAAPDAEVHRFVNDLERPIGTYLYGRRMYETMRSWETALTVPGQSPEARDFASIWQAAEKVVYSRTLREPATIRTCLERSFDPEWVRRLKQSAERDITVGGADLAAGAIRAGLVDELRLLLVPVIVGNGKRSLPDEAQLNLELVDTRRFASGVVYLDYRIR